MVCRNPSHQGIGMDAIPHRLWVGCAVGRKPSMDACLFVLGDKALSTQIPNRFVAISAAKDEIDRRQHVALRHLRHNETDRWGFWLRWLIAAPLSLLSLRSPPHFAIGMQAGARLIQQGMQSFGATEAELQRHGPVVADDQRCGPMHFFNPIGELARIGHGGRQGNELNGRRAMND